MKSDEIERFYRVVGELVLTASALDDQLNRIVMAVLEIVGLSPMVEPVVATLDISRKIELLRERAKLIPAKDWQKALKGHVDSVESVIKNRNIAAHSVMTVDEGKPRLFSSSAAKLFRSLNLATKTARKVEVDQLEAAIVRGRQALGSGENILMNFQRLAEERKRRMLTRKK